MESTCERLCRRGVSLAGCDPTFEFFQEQDKRSQDLVDKVTPKGQPLLKLDLSMVSCERPTREANEVYERLVKEAWEQWSQQIEREFYIQYARGIRRPIIQACGDTVPCFILMEEMMAENMVTWFKGLVREAGQKHERI